MRSDEEKGQALGEALAAARERMNPESRARFDATLQDAMSQTMRRFTEMQQTMYALRLLHKPGSGERQGFCVECGNVTPCQTLKFIQAFC